MRALREIYLEPFRIMQKIGNPRAYMTGYNRVNGLHVSENQFLLQQVLREEWGFDGAVMSDWTGVYSCDISESRAIDSRVSRRLNSLHELRRYQSRTGSRDAGSTCLSRQSDHATAGMWQAGRVRPRCMRPQCKFSSHLTELSLDRLTVLAGCTGPQPCQIRT
jgi:hypothetical protein